MIASKPPQAVTNLLTFDVEDWFHGLGFSPAEWSQFEPRLSVGLEQVLDLLALHGVRATFFVLGSLVEGWRPLLGRIVDEGHELATHSFHHIPLHQMNPSRFAQDLCRSLQTLHTLTAKPITSFRAPFFSLTRQTLWALPILAAAGIQCDSSVVPAHNPRYGIPDAPRFPHRWSLNGRGPMVDMLEYPISTLRMGKLNLPFAGGFYARLLPYRLIRRAVSALNRDGQPAVFYFHPWEFDPGQPRIPGKVSALYRFTHYYQLEGTAGKLQALLQDFRFGPLG